MAAPRQVPPSHEQERDPNHCFFLRHSYDVLIIKVGGNHILPFHRVLYGPDLVPDPRSSFEIKDFGGPLHVLFQVFQQFPVSSLEKQPHLLNYVLINSGRDFFSAWSQAAAQLKVQAGTGPIRQPSIFALPKLENAVNDSQGTSY